VPPPRLRWSATPGRQDTPKDDTPDPGPLSDRVQAIEQHIEEIIRRLEHVEEQQKSLDARIGGGRGARGGLRRTEEAKKK
jgi:hypothetical protein